MAHGGLWAPPYPGVGRIVGWVDANKHAFDGWCLSRGIDYLSLKTPRVLNLAAHLMLDQEDTKEKRQNLFHELNGRFRTMGRKLTRDELNAPAWWHGDEEAYESTMAAMAALPARKRRR